MAENMNMAERVIHRHTLYLLLIHCLVVLGVKNEIGDFTRNSHKHPAKLIPRKAQTSVSGKHNGKGSFVAAIDLGRFTDHHANGLSEEDLNVLLHILIEDSVKKRKVHRTQVSQKKHVEKTIGKKLVSRKQLSKLLHKANAVASKRQHESHSQRSYKLPKTGSHTVRVYEEHLPGKAKAHWKPTDISKEGRTPKKYNSSSSSNHLSTHQPHLSSEQGQNSQYVPQRHRLRHRGSGFHVNHQTLHTSSEDLKRKYPKSSDQDKSSYVNSSDQDTDTEDKMLYDKAVNEWREKTTEELLNRPNSTCDCENGGSCIFKVVCACPEDYYGMRCQHKLHHHSCGDVRHGTWIRDGCTLCRCQDGNMMCLTQDIDDCGRKFDGKEELLDTIDTYISPTPSSLSDEYLDEYDDYLETADILVYDFQSLPVPSNGHSITKACLLSLFQMYTVYAVL